MRGSGRAFDFAQEISLATEPEWLPRTLLRAAQGRFPDADHDVRLTPGVTGAKAAVVAFTAHHVIASELEPGVTERELRRRGVQLPTDPRFLAGAGRWLGVEGHDRRRLGTSGDREVVGVTDVAARR
jgi:hypothetical protein